jgi:hypothetical protein
MIGQSNMAGRGKKEEVEPIENKELKVMRNGRWQNMYVPVNCDRAFSGISLAESFADAYQKDHQVQVGLIPCADGGTSLDQWKEGSLLYDHAVFQAKLAMRTSNIAGILWHQGESDCKVERYSTYAERFQKFVDAIKRDLNLYDVPFLVGGLGDFLKDRVENPEMQNYMHVNTALRQVAVQNEMMGFVSAEGLESKPDRLHFNAVSLREFGLRYYEVFKKIEKKDKIFEEKPEADAAIRSEIELL